MWQLLNLYTDFSLSLMNLWTLLQFLYLFQILVLRTEELEFTKGPVPWVKHLVTGLSPQKSAFEPMPVCLGSVGDKVALGHAFVWVLWLSTVGIMLPMLHTHSSIFHHCYIISAIETVSSNNTLPFSVSLFPFLDARNAMSPTYNSLPLLHQLLLLSQFCHIYQSTESSGFFQFNSILYSHSAQSTTVHTEPQDMESVKIRSKT
jgi:hypothetical protein